tara:strand:+ start:128 stop:481 length:354 start_codon:yes stop_codon:yes gene_type:complete
MSEISSYYTISNVSKKLNIPPHVLRFWEKKFNFVRPKKSETGRRYYSNQDIVNLEIIKDLLHEKGYTISGAIKYMKNNDNLDDNKLDKFNINNQSLINKINQTSDLISKAKNILEKY